MDTFKDFLQDIKDRLTNPLISSFIITWLFSNWPITIGFLFYRVNELQLDGYQSYYMLVKCNASWLHMFYYPLLGMAFYTFLFPFIRARIKLFHAKIIADNDSDILIASKDGKMPVIKYIKLKDEHNAMLDKLNGLYDSESGYLQEIVDLKEDKNRLIEEVQNEKENTKKGTDYMSLLESRTRIETLNGKWEVFSNIITNGVREVWNIRNGIIESEEGKKFRITEFLSDPFNRKLYVKFKSEETVVKDYFYIISIAPNFNTLTATASNTSDRIIFKKQDTQSDIINLI